MKTLLCRALFLATVLIFPIIGHPQANISVDQMKEEREKNYSSFRTALLGSKELDPIRSKVQLLGNSASLQQLADTTRASAVEKKALEKYAEFLNVYKEKELTIFARYVPFLVATQRDFFNKQEFLIADLYASKITFGEFNKRLREVTEDYKLKAEQIVADRISAINQSREQSEARARQEEARARQEEARARQESALKTAAMERCNAMRETYKRRFEEYDSVASRVLSLPTGDTKKDIAKMQQREREKMVLDELENRIISQCGSR